MSSYYGSPIIKPPVWKWMVPAYFFTGGVAAGTSLLAAGGRLTGDRVLARRCIVASAGATAASTVLLVADLGRPARFLNMLRVAKATSPMSVGSWILAAFGTATSAAATAELLTWDGSVPGVAGGVSAVLAPALGTYTAVLISDTAVPVWHEARRELPFVFAGGAIASGAGLAMLLSDSPAVRRAALLGAAMELLAARLMERRLGALAGPYHHGIGARLSKLATATTALGAVLTRHRHAAGLLLLAGAAAERFAVFQAGMASARDPAQTVGPQRQRL